jgi:prepilin-type N-terminal cleavage/methylation domain-containing protein
MPHSHGFTLIELLVVIAIIGILSSVVLASLNGARKKGRDSRRISDLKQMQLALELYYDSNGVEYPDALSSLATTYISAVPTDPQTGSGYAYDISRVLRRRVPSPPASARTMCSVPHLRIPATRRSAMISMAPLDRWRVPTQSIAFSRSEGYAIIAAAIAATSAIARITRQSDHQDFAVAEVAGVSSSSMSSEPLSSNPTSPMLASRNQASTLAPSAPLGAGVCTSPSTSWVKLTSARPRAFSHSRYWRSSSGVSRGRFFFAICRSV